MSLLQEAKRVAAEFEYDTEALNKGVQEFIREMGMCSPKETLQHEFFLRLRRLQMRACRSKEQL